MKRSSPPGTCPCVRDEKPRCREGANCWHFGNNRGTCDHCHCTGYVVPLRQSINGDER